MHETQQELRQILNAADQLLRGFIGQLESIVNTPTAKSEYETRKQAMLSLNRSAHIEAERFAAWMNQGVWIKHIVEIHGALDSVRMTAYHATIGSSRIWGRTPLRKELEKLQQLFGNGCECQMEIQSARTEPSGPVLKYKLKQSTENASEYLSVEEVAQFLNVSRGTVTKLFERYQGVLDLSSGNARKNGRRYRTLRIPRSVLNRLVKERCVG